MACSVLCKRRIACFGQVCFHCLERLQQTPSVVFGNASQCLPADNIAELTNLFEFGACRLHKMEKPCAAVGRMRLPFNQSQRLELVHDAAKRDRLDFEELREALLIDALVPREVGQNLPLRPGESGSAGILFQPLLQQAGYVVQQEGKRGRVYFQWPETPKLA